MVEVQYIPIPKLCSAVCEIVDHSYGSRLLLHLKESLILSLQHQHVGDPSEWDAKMNDLSLGNIIRYIADMNDF